jgi:hypothetical protein
MHIFRLRFRLNTPVLSLPVPDVMWLFMVILGLLSRLKHNMLLFFSSHLKAIWPAWQA